MAKVKEGSKKEQAQDAREAKRAGMSVKKYEGSAADKRADKKKGMKPRGTKY